ncbi:hypothetical protein F4818DRAFT_378442 [Hypoxylon cercidicola]|nr:hypothetical protein F4818DRAFT_378442 [Hypoxylon cercidicola]
MISMAPQKSKAFAKRKGKKKEAQVPAAAKAAKRAEERAQKAAEKEAAREEALRKRRRDAEKVEKPTSLIDDLLVLPKTQTTTQKRSANEAFDDHGKNKRVQFSTNVNRHDEGPPAFPWETNKKLEQPPSTIDLSIGFASMSLDPIRAMGDLGKFPTEIRDQILGCLLISSDDIKVFQGWSLVYPRTKPCLDLAILRTCNVIRLQGIRILYGENTFLYNIRDFRKHLPHAHLVLDKVYRGCGIPIDKYGHLIRHIKIHIESTRLTIPNLDNFTKALQKFLPDNDLLEPANIHTLTVEVPVVEREDLKRPNMVPVWDFFSGSVREALKQLNIQFVRIVAMVPMSDVRYEHMIDLRYFHKQRQGQSDDTHESPAMKKHFQDMVHTGQVRLYNIPVRIWELTILGPEQANKKKLFWKQLEKEVDPIRKRLASLTKQPSKARQMAQWLEGVVEGDPTDGA